MKYKNPLLEKIWALAPVAIWFSYYPLLRLGKDASMNFELSITLTYLLILALVGTPAIWTARKHLWKLASVRLVSVFMVVSGLSILWSANSKRGVLTFGVMGMLYLVFLATMAQKERFRALLPTLERVFIASAVVMSLLSFVQLVAAIWLEPNAALLCRGCPPAQFGFARPNVFTIEPQFFGNMLLAPAIILLHKLFRNDYSRALLLSFMVIVTALCVTLSRGAIFAFAIAVIVLAIVDRPRVKSVVTAASLLLASFVACLLLQGTSAALNPDINVSFKNAVISSVEQLSLGVIDLEVNDNPPDPVVLVQPQSVGNAEDIPDPKSKETLPNFDGYVEESTNIRLQLSELAIQSWAKSAPRVVFGVGLGGSGVILRNEFPDKVNTGEIVQNEFIEQLLENGLVGIALFGSIIGALLYALRASKWTWAILAAFLVQWNFFSGYPNAIHIYLVLIVLFVCLGTSQKKPAKS